MIMQYKIFFFDFFDNFVHRFQNFYSHAFVYKETHNINVDLIMIPIIWTIFIQFNS